MAIKMNNLSPNFDLRMADVANELPVLPSAIRYYDEFNGKHQSIRNPGAAKIWEIKYSGKLTNLNFSNVEQSLSLILKHVTVDMLSTMSPSSTAQIISGILGSEAARGYLIRAILLKPSEFRDVWIKEIQPNHSWSFCHCIRASLHSICNMSIGFWRPESRAYVSLLKSPTQDAYKTVRTGECFIPLQDQSKIIDYLDELSHTARKNPEVIPLAELRNACILIISHQYAFRPGQIARLKSIDVRFFDGGAVHVSLPLLKQRRNNVLRMVTRRINREWCPIFIAYDLKLSMKDLDAPIKPALFFSLTPANVSRVLSDQIELIIGSRWSATDVRHTAAQRLVDGGISHIGLSEFLGHATVLPAGVYFDASPSQAERVNQALAISDIYSHVAEIARTGTIEKEELLLLPTDEQIGGVPHGIPIAGIGACAQGQSLCSKNPILSCYTCRKFLPLADPEIHDSVIESLRPVVADFAQASRFDEESPAYTQLRRMFDAATGVSEGIRIRKCREATKSE